MQEKICVTPPLRVQSGNNGEPKKRADLFGVQDGGSKKNSLLTGPRNHIWTGGQRSRRCTRSSGASKISGAEGGQGQPREAGAHEATNQGVLQQDLRFLGAKGRCKKGPGAIREFVRGHCSGGYRATTRSEKGGLTRCPGSTSGMVKS